MALTDEQINLVYECVVLDQEGVEPYEILRRFIRFVLTHTPLETKNEMRRVVQEHRATVQAQYDAADAANAANKAVLDNRLIDLDDTDTELGA